MGNLVARESTKKNCQSRGEYQSATQQRFYIGRPPVKNPVENRRCHEREVEKGPQIRRISHVTICYGLSGLIENAKDAEPNDHRDNVPLAEAAERSHRLLRDKWQELSNKA